jgi:tRNA(adenine34) deaminase
MNAPVAQLDRAPDYGSGGLGFESLRAYECIERESGFRMSEHIRWMGKAIKEAEKALSQNEVPVGAVIVYDGQIIGKGYNQTETLQDPTAHAEMIAISAAAGFFESGHLEKCSLYVTLEPCAMCAGALVLARIENLIIGAMDSKAGACGSLRNIVQDYRLNHYVNVMTGILRQESSQLLKTFFQNLRREKEIL